MGEINVGDVVLGRRARGARMRRCLILRQGASPLRPPAPFPLPFILGNGTTVSRVRKPRTKCAPLTPPFRSEDLTVIRERGPKKSCPLQIWVRLPLVGTHPGYPVERL